MDKIYFYDDMGVRQEIAKNTIWGYARNGVIVCSDSGKLQQDYLCWQHLSFCC